MAAVRRPFEAHLFACGQRRSTNPNNIPPASRRPSGDRAGTEKWAPESNMPAYNHATSTYTFTNADVETLDLNASRPNSVIQPPSPKRDQAGLGIFTSSFAPSPLLPAFMVSADSPSVQCQSSASYPFAHRRRLSLTPRTDALLAPAAYVPYSIPIEFSASAQRAVHPDTSAPYRPQPYLRSMSIFSNYHRYSQSSISLTRPPRLSSLTPISHLECSSGSSTLRSSKGISEMDESPNSKSSNPSDKRPSAAGIVYTTVNTTPFFGATKANPRNHWRTFSTPNVMSSAQKTASGERMAMGWKPNLEKSKTVLRKP